METISTVEALEKVNRTSVALCDEIVPVSSAGNRVLSEGITTMEPLCTHNPFGLSITEKSLEASSSVFDTSVDSILGTMTMPAGSRLVEPGTRISAREIAVAALCGNEYLKVYRVPRLALAAIGDSRSDPVPVACADAAREAFISSGIHVSWSDVHYLEIGGVMHWLKETLDGSDVIVLNCDMTGSAANSLSAMVRALGFDVHFEQVSQFPCMLMLYATMGEKQLYCLHARPASTLTGIYRYILPALSRRQGLGARKQVWATLSQGITCTNGVHCYVPVTLESRRDGAMTAFPHPVEHDGDFTSLLGTQGFIELPAEDMQEFPPGFAAQFHGWSNCT